MGYARARADYCPASRRSGASDRIVRMSDAVCGPGDDFCALWHMLDLLPEGASRWQPKVSYKEDRR